MGDLVHLETGNKVPADGIVVRCNDLKCNESALTVGWYSGLHSCGAACTHDYSSSMYRGHGCIVEVDTRFLDLLPAQPQLHLYRTCPQGESDDIVKDAVDAPLLISGAQVRLPRL